MSKYIGSTLISGVGRSTVRNAHTLLDFKWSDHIINSMEWLRADTFSWQAGSVYQAVYNHLVADIIGKTAQSETVAGVEIYYYLADDGHKIIGTSMESAAIDIYNATGVAWYYILDEANTRFKLPRTKFGFTGIRDTVGKYVEAGLPNINGTFKSDSTNGSTSTGAFSASSSSSSHGWDGHGATAIYTFDASRSSSIYGNSNTVQPPATQMYLYFYVGQYTQSAIEQTAGLNASLFNGKQDVLTGVSGSGDYVVSWQEPTAGNNYTWYRKYKSGWVEQGGVWSHPSPGTYYNTVTITLPITMADANYSVILSPTGTNTTLYSKTVSSKTTTQFVCNSAGDGSRYNGFDWQVSGMAA